MLFSSLLKELLVENFRRQLHFLAKPYPRLTLASTSNYYMCGSNAIRTLSQSSCPPHLLSGQGIIGY